MPHHSTSLDRIVQTFSWQFIVFEFNITTLFIYQLHNVAFMLFFLPPVFRWRLNGWDVEIPEEGNGHYSLMGGNLVISRPDKSIHAGNYSCLATNEFGTVISREASIQFGCE